MTTVARLKPPVDFVFSADQRAERNELAKQLLLAAFGGIGGGKGNRENDMWAVAVSKSAFRVAEVFIREREVHHQRY